MVLISSIAIPTSIIATFTFMRLMDFSLNSMTLLGLTLAVGIVIDDAIIVMENIYRFIQEKGQPPMQAAIEATKEISLAVMATTLSLVIIFVPIAFMSGYAKRFMNEFGWTMALSIMVSMLVAFTLTPTLSARLLGWRRKREKSSRILTNRICWSEIMCECSDGPCSSVGRCGRLLIVTLGSTFVINKYIGRDWMPQEDQWELGLWLEVPEGSPRGRDRKACARSSSSNRENPRRHCRNPGQPGHDPPHHHELHDDPAAAAQRREDIGDNGTEDPCLLRDYAFARPAHDLPQRARRTRYILSNPRATAGARHAAAGRCREGGRVRK